MVLYSNPSHEVHVTPSSSKLSFLDYVGNTFLITILTAKKTFVRGMISFIKIQENNNVLYGFLWLDNESKNLNINTSYQCQITKQMTLERNKIEIKIDAQLTLKVLN